MKAFMAMTRVFEVAVLGVLSGAIMTFGFDGAGQSKHSSVLTPDQLTWRSELGPAP